LEAASKSGILTVNLGVHALGFQGVGFGRRSLVSSNCDQLH
jgi:hypothetical protein